MTKEENETRLAKLKNIVLNLPEKPGSYQYYDQEGTIIYVGKAKNLKARVSSYFHKEVDRYKTKVLVSKIWNITYTVVNSEEDALLLENSLIKQYNPRYNVLLKDGKTYPSICMTKEYLPRVFKTRTINKKWGQYFGPYSHIGSMYALLEIIKKIYKPRTCRFPITKEGIAEGKYKPCLEYHIHNCGAPCIGKQSYEEYQENMNQAREILKGHTREVQKMLFEQMQKAAEELRFEDAQALKIRIEALENFASKSEVVSHTISDVDVFSITSDEKNAYINYIHVENGQINQSFTFEYKKKLNESDEDLLQLGIIEMRERFKSTAKEIILPEGIEIELEGVTLMKELQTALKLPHLPYQIECFDNSNISGTDAVAGCVVFKGMKPSKKDYRKYNIKTVVGPDDYASMQEVVRRRYSRMIEEGTPLPDLIITDGGVGQMHVVREVVIDELELDIPIAGLAKDDRHRTNELLFGWPAQTIGIDIKSELFKVLTQIQDEVHRYAITFHRDKRSKHALHSELDEIKGIGPKTKALLIKKLKSVKQIKLADLQTLTEHIGENKGKIVFEYFHPEIKGTDK